MNHIRTVLISCIIFLLQYSVKGQDSTTSGIIQANQFELSYIIEGQGQPAIVIGSAIYYSRVFSENLRNHLKFVFLDHRGFVKSPDNIDTTDYSLDKIIDDIEQARQQLNLGKIIIVGHSGHSYMALEYAKKYSEHVKNVVMIGISPNLGAKTEQLIAQNWKESVDIERKKALEENKRRMPDEELAKLSPRDAYIQGYVRDGPKAWYNPYFDATPFWEDVEMNLDMFAYMWGSVFWYIDITKGLEDFDKSIFLALGRYDYLVGPPSMWEPIRPLFQDLTVRIFEKSGHTPQYEQSKLFDEELLKWLEQKK